MSSRCSRIEAYVDDTLSTTERHAFEAHLLGCERCQNELEAGMQLVAAGRELADRPDRPRVKEPDIAERRAVVAARRGRGPLIAVGCLAAIAIAVVVWRVVLPEAATPSIEERVISVLGPRRTVLVRLPYEPLDRHRPYDTARGAGDPEPIPLQLAAEVESARGAGSLAAVLLARRDLDQAAALLARSEGDDVEIARGVLALLRRRPEAALASFDAILAKSPAHSVAAWNRALALADLELPLAAAEMFDVVAASADTGWNAEARTRAEELRREHTRRAASWQEAKRVCDALANGTVESPDLIARHIAVCRPSFYEAARIAPDRAARLALVSIAELVDAGTAQHAARELLQRIEVPRRDRAAKAYAQLTRSKTLSAADKSKLLDELRSSGFEDLLLGAIPRSGLPGLRAELLARTRASTDPYFVQHATELGAAELLSRGDALAAVALLEPAATACASKDLELRCQYFHFGLAAVYQALHRPAKSREVVRAALARSKRLGFYWDERQLFDYLAEASHLENEHAQMRAYLREATLRSGGECLQEQFALESLAAASVDQLEFARASRELASAPTCNEPETIERVRVRAELAHVDGIDTDVEAVRRSLERLRTPELAVGERAQLDATEGRLVAARDPIAATPILRRAITATRDSAPTDVPAAKARADAFASLIVISARGPDHAATLALFEEATGVSATAPCVVGALVDADRVAVVARTADGALLQHFDPRGRRSTKIDAASLIPKRIRDAVAGCARIDVLALPPLYGLPNLLPPELAWSYRTRGARNVVPASGPVKVVSIANPEPPRDVGFAPLMTAALTPIAGATHVDLRGAEATPSAVLSRLSGADAIEIHAHGYINVGESEASLIALSPEPSGRFTLTAQDLSSVALPRAPIVVLAVCHAAYSAPYRHESWGLPLAFLRSGARAVLASRETISDRDAAAFFRAVEARILAGSDAAVALRDERKRMLAIDPESWAAGVLLFD